MNELTFLPSRRRFFGSLALGAAAATELRTDIELQASMWRMKQVRRCPLASLYTGAELRMNALRIPRWIAKPLLLSLFLATVFLSSIAETLHADDVTYRVIPAGIGGAGQLAGGTITTDGTLGLLSTENFISMSVDIELKAVLVRAGMPEEVIDGSTTLDLTNAALAIDGEILATPTGIFVAPPPVGPDPYSLTIDGGDASVVWSSTNTESSGIRYGLSVESLPAGGGIRHFFGFRFGCTSDT